MLARLAEYVSLRTFDGWRSPEKNPDAEWRRSVAAADLRFREAVGLVQASGVAVLVDPDGRLLGTITDTDIRRGLLRGVRDDDPARLVMDAAPTAALGSGEPNRAHARDRNTRAPRAIVDQSRRVVGVQPAETPSVADRLVVIMAGGYGTRLRPLTDHRPKPLVAIAGRPLLERTIERLHAQGFRRILLCVGYEADLIERHFGDGERFGVHLTYLGDDALLGTAGPLGLIEHRPAAGLLVINGDIVTSTDYRRLMAFHDDSDVVATMCVCEAEVRTPYGVVQIQDQCIQAIAEKPAHRCFVNGGIYVLEPRALDLIPRHVRFDMPALFTALIGQQQRVAAFPLYEEWIDVGNPRDLDHANSRLDLRERCCGDRITDSSLQAPADRRDGFEVMVEDL